MGRSGLLMLLVLLLMLLLLMLLLLLPGLLFGLLRLLFGLLRLLFGLLLGPPLGPSLLLLILRLLACGSVIYCCA